MSQESFEVVAELARDFEQGDWVRVRALFTDDAELQPPEGWPEAGPFLAETPSFGSSGASKKPGERTEWRSPVSPKRKIGLVVRIDWGVEGATSGLPTQLTVFAIRLDGQLISGYRAYWDRGKALEAAGLSE
jgi:hypothetical protein